MRFRWGGGGEWGGAVTYVVMVRQPRHVQCVILLLFLFPVTVSAQSNGGRLVCQDKWKKGEKVKLVFFISEARFPSQCVSSNHQPYFARSPDGASNTYKVKCTLTNVTAPGACNGSFISNTLGCGCRGKNGSFVVEYNFIAQKEHAGWWKPGLQCLDSGGVQQLNFTSTNCENKIVESSEFLFVR